MNGDLISRSALMEKLGDRARKHDYDECTELTIYEDMHEVKVAPAVDAVEVVRCKDCAWCRKPFPEHFPQKLECMRFDMEVAADEFCSRSERRTEE